MLVRNALVGCGLKDEIRLAASGKQISAFAMAASMALGADFPLLAALLDLAFLPVVALSLGLRAWHARQRRQVVLLLVLMKCIASLSMMDL